MSIKKMFKREKVQRFLLIAGGILVGQLLVMITLHHNKVVAC